MITHYTSALFIFFFRFSFHEDFWSSRRLLRSGTLLGGTELLGRELDRHPLTFQNRHLIHLGIILQIVGKTKQQHFTLLFEKDRTAFEEHVSFHFIAVFKETFGMFQLEISPSPALPFVPSDVSSTDKGI